MAILNMQTPPGIEGVSLAGNLVFSVGGQILDGVSSVKFGNDDGDGKLASSDDVVEVTITCAVTLGKGGVCQS